MFTDSTYDQERNGLLGLGSARPIVPVPQPVLQQFFARILGFVARIDLVHRRFAAVLLAGNSISGFIRMKTLWLFENQIQ